MRITTICLVLISISTLMIGTVYAEESNIAREDFIHELSNDSNGTLDDSNTTVDLINGTMISEDNSDTNISEEYPYTPTQTEKKSPGFEFAIAIMIILAIFANKKRQE